MFLLSQLAVPKAPAGLEMPQNICPSRGRVLQPCWSHGQGCTPRDPQSPCAELPGACAGFWTGSGARGHLDQSSWRCLWGPQGGTNYGSRHPRLSPHLPGRGFRCRRGRERCPVAPVAPQPPPRREQRPACVRIALLGIPAPKPGISRTPGAPGLPPCPTPPPLSPAALCLPFSRCPASPRLPPGIPNPRAVPSRSPPLPGEFEGGCRSPGRVCLISPLLTALLGRCPGRRCRTASGRAGSESAQVPGPA